MSAPLLKACAALEVPAQAVASALAARPLGAEAPRRVLVVGARHGDGATTLAACTAISLCRTLHAPVTLVEANPYSPALAAYVDGPPTPGFADVLRGGAEGSAVVRESFEPGLGLVPAGSWQSGEPVDWSGPTVRALLEETSRSSRFVLVDAPPLLDRPAGRLLLGLCDRVVLVLRAGATTKADAREAQRILEGAGANVAGVVLNRAHPSRLA